MVVNQLIPTSFYPPPHPIFISKIIFQSQTSFSTFERAGKRVLAKKNNKL